MKRVNEVGRRGFLASAAAVAGAGLVAADRGAAVAAVQSAANVPFHGAHQAGIITPAQRATAFVSFDTTAADRSNSPTCCGR